MSEARQSRVWRVLLPGLAFQAIMVGGGYSTGRELVEFFLPAGPLGGLLAMGVTAFIFSLTLAIVYELARQARTYDYSRFFQTLIGRAALVFDIAYFLLTVLVLSIIAASAGAIVSDAFGLSSLTGVIGITLASMLLLYFGGPTVERLLSWWSIVLYICFGALFIITFATFADRVGTALATPAILGEVLPAGLAYAGININCFAAVLFLIPKLETRGEAVTAGLLTGPIAMAPGILFFMALSAFHTEIGKAEIPLNLLLDRLSLPGFMLAVQVIILVTLLKTGVGILHSINDRVAATAAALSWPLPNWGRAAIALAFILFSVTVAERVGLIALIDQGYRTLSWVFILLIFVPVFTIGLRQFLLGSPQPSRGVSSGASVR